MNALNNFFSLKTYLVYQVHNAGLRVGVFLQGFSQWKLFKFFTPKQLQKRALKKTHCYVLYNHFKIKFCDLKLSKQNAICDGHLNRHHFSDEQKDRKIDIGMYMQFKMES